MQIEWITDEVVKLEKFGCFVKIVKIGDGELLLCAMAPDGLPGTDMDGETPDWREQEQTNILECQELQYPDYLKGGNMLVPAIKEYLTVTAMQSLPVCEKLHIDSGLGGSFTVVYQGVEDNKMVFTLIHPELKPRNFRYSVETAVKEVYQLVPESPFDREYEPKGCDACWGFKHPGYIQTGKGPNDWAQCPQCNQVKHRHHEVVRGVAGRYLWELRTPVKQHLGLPRSLVIYRYGIRVHYEDEKRFEWSKNAEGEFTIDASLARAKRVYASKREIDRAIARHRQYVMDHETTH